MSTSVLVVDDAAEVRETIAAIFEDLGFEVLQAGGGHDALSVLADEHVELTLLFTDVQMPGMDGPTLAAEARKLRPGLKVIFTSGLAGRPRGDSPFIAKPFRRKLLCEVVAQTLGHWGQSERPGDTSKRS
jgi:CheY-like chemotaxis protein